MIEQDLIDLGFHFVKQYPHDQFFTRVYKKGLIEVDFTYEFGEIESVTMNISEANGEVATLAIIKALTPILGEIEVA